MESPATLDLVTASSNPLLLDGLRSLQALGNFQILGEGRDAEEVLRLLVLYSPRALVAEVGLLVEASSLLLECRQCQPDLKVVALEGPADFVHSFPPNAQPDALVRRTSSLAAVARVIESLCSAGEPVSGLE